MRGARNPDRVLQAIHALGTADEARWVRELLGEHADLFASARHVADIALLGPSSAEAEVAAVRGIVVRNQRDYAVTSERQIREGAISGDVLETDEGAFGCVIAVGASEMPLDVFRKLAQFAASGGRLIFVEPAPSRGASAEETEALAEMWPGLLDAKHVAIVADARQCLTVLNRWLPPDVWLDEPCDSLVYCHCEVGGRHLYLLVNCGEEWVERTATLRGEAEAREVRVRLGGHDGLLLV
ncbi:MAG: hypothetical protein FJ313_02015 [Gemmatimonadetes bacterium]|nr:hypothetical protein [Gemmatimonadota bacterium]